MTDKTIIDQSNVDDTRTHFHVAVAGRKFMMPLLHEELTADEPVVRFAAALQTVGELHEATTAAMSDVTLSEIGRQQKLDPQREKALKYIAGHAVEIDKIEATVAAREAKLLAVPELHESASAHAVIDGEIRGWWRSQTVAERADLMRRMQEEPGHERIAIALLRSPYALADLETTSVRDTWNRAKRLDNPGEAAAINRARVVVEWARRGLNHIAGIASLVTKFERTRVAEVVLTEDASGSTAVKVFGFPADWVADFKRRLEGKRGIDAARARRPA